MLFYLLLVSAFFIFNNKQINLLVIKWFLSFNIFIFFIFNYQSLKLNDDLFFYFFLIFVIIFSNKNTIFLIYACIYMKSENLLINIIFIEIVNAIFFI